MFLKLVRFSYSDLLSPFPLPTLTPSPTSHDVLKLSDRLTDFRIQIQTSKRLGRKQNSSGWFFIRVPLFPLLH